MPCRTVANSRPVEACDLEFPERWMLGSMVGGSHEDKDFGSSSRPGCRKTVEGFPKMSSRASGQFREIHHWRGLRKTDYKPTRRYKSGSHERLGGLALVDKSCALAIHIRSEAQSSVHHGHHSLRGCAVSGPNGLQLRNRGDQQTYALTGEVASIKPGEQVRVSGRKQKKSGAAPPQFLVDNLTKDYGSCTAGVAPPQVAKSD